jgi:hypothetical protein
MPHARSDTKENMRAESLSERSALTLCPHVSFRFHRWIGKRRVAREAGDGIPAEFVQFRGCFNQVRAHLTKSETELTCSATDLTKSVADLIEFVTDLVNLPAKNSQCHARKADIP